MARLGELLVAAKVLTAGQVEQALRAQVMWGGRLGTNLVELGFLDLDALSKALGRQFRQPAALARHFERIDRELQAKLSADVAERFSVVPIARLGAARDRIAIVSTAPLDRRALAIVADELGVDPSQLVTSIAAELRIRYHLERGYGIPRGTRFLRAKGKSGPPVPQFVIEQVAPDTLGESDEELDIDGLTQSANESIPEPIPDGVDVDFTDDDVSTRPYLVSAPVAAPDPKPRTYPTTRPRLAAARPAAPAPEPPLTLQDPIDDLSSIAVLEDEELGVPAEAIESEVTGKERRRFIPTIGDEPEPKAAEPGPEPGKGTIGRIAIRKVVAAAAPAGTRRITASASATLGEAARAIRRGGNRDTVGDLVLNAVERFVPTCEAALLLVIRGDIAVGWKSFHRGGASIPEIGVPLCEPGLVPRVVQRATSMRAPAGDLTPVDQELLASLEPAAGDLLVVPVTISGQVLCLVALACARDEPVASTETIAGAAGAAFARLIRDASR